MHGSLDGLSADWPALADPGAAGSLLSDPFTALRNWLASIATGVSADGKAFLPQILPWLRGLLSDALPDAPAASAGQIQPSDLGIGNLRRSVVSSAYDLVTANPTLCSGSNRQDLRQTGPRR